MSTKWGRFVPGREALIVLCLQVVLLVFVITVWEVFGGNPSETSWKFIDEFYFSKPSAILAVLMKWGTEGSIWRHILITLQETLIGWLIGCVVGMMTGLALGIARRLSRVLNPFILSAYSIPKLALAPLFLLWFGLGIESKIAFVATIAFFLIFYNTYTGVRLVSKDQVELLEIMGASRAQVHLMVTLPSAATWVMSALHVTVPYAFVGAVVAEMIAANVGIGFLIQQASANFQTAQLIAAVAVLMTLALILNAIVSAIERVVLRWKVAEQSAVVQDPGV